MRKRKQIDIGTVLKMFAGIVIVVTLLVAIRNHEVTVQPIQLLSNRLQSLQQWGNDWMQRGINGFPNIIPASPDFSHTAVPSK